MYSNAWLEQGEKLAQAPAWEICSAGQCGQNRRCFQGDPVLCFFWGKGGDSENLPFTGAAKTCIPKYCVTRQRFEVFSLD